MVRRKTGQPGGMEKKIAKFEETEKLIRRTPHVQKWYLTKIAYFSPLSNGSAKNT